MAWTNQQVIYKRAQKMKSITCPEVETAGQSGLGLQHGCGGSEGGAAVFLYPGVCSEMIGCDLFTANYTPRFETPSTKHKMSNLRHTMSESVRNRNRAVENKAYNAQSFASPFPSLSIGRDGRLLWWPVTWLLKRPLRQTDGLTLDTARHCDCAV